MWVAISTEYSRSTEAVLYRIASPRGKNLCILESAKLIIMDHLFRLRIYSQGLFLFSTPCSGSGESIAELLEAANLLCTRGITVHVALTLEGQLQSLNQSLNCPSFAIPL